MNAKKALSELYQLTRTAPALTVQLPSELGWQHFLPDNDEWY